MRFFTTLFAAAACVCTAIAGNTGEGIATTDQANPITAPGAQGATAVKAGVPYTIEWYPTAGTSVTLVLRKGTPGSLALIQVIAEDLPNQGAFIWTPSPELAAGADYAIQIVSDAPLTSNYCPRFHIESNGKGIPPKSTLKPEPTLAISVTKTATATYTGELAKPTASEDLKGLKDVDNAAVIIEAGVIVKIVAIASGLVAVAAWL